MTIFFLLLLAVFTHSPLFMLIGLVLLIVAAALALRLVGLILGFIWVAFIVAVYWTGKGSERITSRQWLIGGLSLFVFFIGALVIYPPVGLCVPLVTLPFIFMSKLYSDVNGTKRTPLTAPLSTGSTDSRGPMLVPE
jgi:hypothetical protein